MLTIEKYIDNVMKVIQGELSCNELLKLTNKKCSDFNCDTCKEYLKNWLLSEYKKPEVDWNKIPIDTKIIVWDNPEYKYKRYFAGIKDNEIITYSDGRSSWTSLGEFETWEFAELVEE